MERGCLIKAAFFMHIPDPSLRKAFVMTHLILKQKKLRFIITEAIFIFWSKVVCFCTYIVTTQVRYLVQIK